MDNTLWLQLILFGASVHVILQFFFYIFIRLQDHSHAHTQFRFDLFHQNVPFNYSLLLKH